MLDATEFCCHTSKKWSAISQTYSHYKSHHTLKALVGCPPGGVFIFLSKSNPGCESDKYSTVQSGILDLMEPGDMILADRGFTIHNIGPNGVIVLICHKSPTYHR